VDALALLHDIEYLSKGERWQSDLKAIMGSGWSLQGISMKVGLSSRMLLDSVAHLFGSEFHFNNEPRASLRGEAMQQILLAKAAPWLRKWGIDPSLTLA